MVPERQCVACVNYKLALTKSIANDPTARHVPSASTDIEPMLL